MSRSRVVHRDGEHREAKRVAQQDELLAPVVALLPGGGEELDPPHPFRLGEFHLAGEVVQVMHEAGEDFLEPGIVRVGKAFDHCVGDGVLVQVAHGSSPWLGSV